MRTKKIVSIAAVSLMGAGLLGACDFGGGELPELPDLPPQVCELLPQGFPGCGVSALT